MRNDPPSIWNSAYSEQYEGSNYGNGLAAWVMRQSHVLCERQLGPEKKFSRVLEVGSGSGIHLSYVRHDYDEYWLTDSSEHMLNTTKKRLVDEKVRIAVEDATKLSFPDNHFDRLIASHVLEHLYKPHEVLREWNRVLKPGGTMSLILPCDPGLAWRFGRMLGVRRKAQRNGLDYDYVMAREHVNPITNLVSFIQYYFNNRKEDWWPARLPSSDINLIYVANIIK